MITAISVFVVILAAFGLFGEYILKFFGMGLPAFRVGGSILHLVKVFVKNINMP